jgi:hypothetical protein
MPSPRRVVRLGASRIKFFTRCYAGIYARSCAMRTTGQLPPGGCDPPVSDLRIARCIARAGGPGGGGDRRVVARSELIQRAT